jgi:hypothetical protein
MLGQLAIAEHPMEARQDHQTVEEAAPRTHLVAKYPTSHPAS